MRKRYSYYLILVLAIISFTVKAQQRKQVLLDSYFNDEHMKDATGQMISYHYKWNETDNNGFSIFKAAFKTAGATGITELHGPPNPDVLGSADALESGIRIGHTLLPKLRVTLFGGCGMLGDRRIALADDA